MLMRGKAIMKNENEKGPVQLLNSKEVATKLGIAERTVWRHASVDQTFPKPVAVGRLKRWVESELDEWVMNQVSG